MVNSVFGWRAVAYFFQNTITTSKKQNHKIFKYSERLKQSNRSQSIVFAKELNSHENHPRH